MCAPTALQMGDTRLTISSPSAFGALTKLSPCRPIQSRMGPTCLWSSSPACAALVGNDGLGFQKRRNPSGNR